MLNGCQTLSNTQATNEFRTIASVKVHNASLALIEAVKSADYVAMRDILSTEEVDYEATNPNEHTPLMIAASRGDSIATRLILDSLNSLSTNIFSIAATNIKKNRILNATDSRGNTPLILAAHQHNKIYPWPEQKSETFKIHERIKTISSLVQQSLVNVNAQSDYDKTALIRAAETGNYNILITLLSSGRKIDLDIPDFQGVTALMHACQAGDKNSVLLLLQHGADPGIAANNGNLALAFTADPEIRQILMDYMNSNN